MREFVARFIEAGQPERHVIDIYRGVYGMEVSRLNAKLRSSEILSDPVIKRELAAAKEAQDRYQLPPAAMLQSARRQLADVKGYLTGKPVPDSETRRTAAETKTPPLRNMVISKAVVSEMLASIGYADIRDIVSWDKHGNVHIKASSEIPDYAARAIQSIKVGKAKDGGALIEFKLAPKTQALVNLARLQGWLVDPVEDNKPPATPPEIEAKRKAMQAEVYRMLQLAARPAPLPVDIDEDGNPTAT